MVSADVPSSDSPAPAAVAGHCPMGCGRTLMLDDGGRVTCTLDGCPDRCAVDEILADWEVEHIVEFRANTFLIRHPLRERLDDALMTCNLHAFIEGLSAPPVPLGRYRARGALGGAWTWEPLSDQDVRRAR